MVVPDAPQNLVGDNAYDSDHLDAELKFYGIEVIAPHRRNRRNSTQDGRRLKRYRRRWRIERLFAYDRNDNHAEGSPGGMAAEIEVCGCRITKPPILLVKTVGAINAPEN
jgi:hypothetical protein